MKKLLFLLLIPSLLFSCPVFAAVTTSDGMITLDLQKDTQFTLEDRWILSLVVNDIEGLGTPGKDSFEVVFDNLNLNFINDYNPMSPDYRISEFMYAVLMGTGGSGGHATPGKLQCISSVTHVNSPVSYTFYGLFPGNPATPSFIMGNADVTVSKLIDNFSVVDSETLQLNGPLRVATVPEPSAIALAFLGLVWLVKRKRV